VAEKNRMSALGLLRFLVGRSFLNLKAGFEYRTSFWSQILFMIANNAFMLWFWRLFFHHFGQVKSWKLQDVYLLYAMSAIAFGLSNVFAGSAMDLAGAITDGELDYFIGLPPPTLLHALVTKLRVSAIGDLLFGIVLLFLVFGAHPLHIFSALLVSIPAAVVLTSVMVIVSSLGFFMGESRGMTFQIVHMMVAFSTYPDSIFRGQMRWVLYLLIPAGFMSDLPVHVLQDGTSISSSLISIGELLGGAFGFAALAIFVFHQGLKRYSSGSSMGIRI
jgi:ABC-2 type transport system permease protein